MATRKRKTSQPPAPGPGARRRGRPAGNILDRKDLLLTAALRLFAMQGYERTSLADVARATGVTRPAVYHYYQSKGRLLFEAAMFALGMLLSRLRQVDPASFNNRSQYLATLVRIQSQFEVELRGITPFMNSVLYGPLRDLTDLSGKEKTELRDLQRELVEIYRRVLQDGTASGEFRVENLTVTAFSILGMVSHLAVWYREGGELTSDAVAGLMGELARRLAAAPASAG